MLLYFDKNGQLIEQLVYGPNPRTGTTNFVIYAYFEGVDLDAYNTAYIKLRRPDIFNSTYPLIFMTQNRNFKFHKENVENSDNYKGHFKEDDNPYPVYELKFNTIRDEDHILLALLDTPGKWDASITLMNSSGNSVTGMVRFDVEGSVYDEEPTVYDEGAIDANIQALIASKIGQSDVYYVRFWNKNIEGASAEQESFNDAAENGHLLGAIFVPNTLVIDEAGNFFLITDTNETEDEDYVTATYRQISSGGGGGVVVDTQMSVSSPNPVQNSTITTFVNNKSAETLQASWSKAELGLASDEDIEDLFD